MDKKEIRIMTHEQHENINKVKEVIKGTKYRAEILDLTAALPDLLRGIAPLGPPAPAQPPLLGRGVGPPGSRPWPRAWGRWVAPTSRCP